ncbi:hypothetical protein FCM35_KLT21930 [Carex littledalei]|uniref:Uncharacterized protein n=1 Tax=Carex littledalei TaxID=544730 RepID=A0A833VDG5_9POAL|nr:hypothetical protein FCM35_KLT21930 [Carex littledalei]
MEIDEASSSPSLTPSRVSLPLSTRLTSCLSSSYSEPSKPSCVATRKLSWITLQGRLVGVDGATSARAVGPGLSRDEAVAWELFSPLHRVLLVALVAAATAKSRASQKIRELKRSVDLRDRALEAMQLKLDSLCEEINSIQDAVGPKLEKTEAQHDNSLTNLVEQEERRMSDLSDFCWSVASSFDNQMSSLASEQELYNLQKECEEKDATIKELLSAVQVSKIADTKRITELEQLVKRKNMVISKLKKDMEVLEQMVVDITRSRRTSSALSLGSTEEEIPVMVNNILFDMSSSSSSSESESPFASEEHLLGPVGFAPSQEPVTLAKKKSRQMLLKKIEPSTEKHTKKKTEITGVVRPRPMAASSEGFKRTRRGTQHEPKSVVQRRWV